MNTEIKSSTLEKDPHRWIEILREGQDSLAALVAPLTLEQLSSPSYHSWSIAQVLGHLGSQAEIYLGWLDAALQHTEPAGREAMQPVWDAWDGRSAEAKAADSIEYNERLVRRFEALREEELSRMHLDLFGMQLDAVGLARLRLAEVSVHTWDIAVALDPSAEVSARAVDLLIDTLGMIAGHTGKPQGKTYRLRVRTTAPERELSLRVADAVELTQWEGGSEDGVVHIPAEAFLRLVYGRLDEDHTPEYEIAGSASLEDLREVFPGV